MSEVLKGKVALVAGATRGAGRGIAVELSAGGTTVYCTGRTTRTQPSVLDRPETIEETAELVQHAGGQGIAVQVDHLDPAQVQALVARIESEQSRLDVMVNDSKYRLSLFYDLAKTSVVRMAWAQAQASAPSVHRRCPDSRLDAFGEDAGELRCQ